MLRGLDEAKALYELELQKQLLRIQAERNTGGSWEDIETDIFSDDFLLTVRCSKPSGPRIRSCCSRRGRSGRVETEALLLEILSD